MSSISRLYPDSLARIKIFRATSIPLKSILGSGSVKPSSSAFFTTSIKELLLLKLLPDLLVVIIGSFFYKENKLWKYSLPMFLLYPLILVLIILLQATKYKVKWKERDLLNI